MSYSQLILNKDQNERDFTNRLGMSEFVIGFPCLPSVFSILSVTLALGSTSCSLLSASSTFPSMPSLLGFFSLRLLKNSAFRFLRFSSFLLCCFLSFSRPLFDCSRQSFGSCLPVDGLGSGFLRGILQFCREEDDKAVGGGDMGSIPGEDDGVIFRKGVEPYHNS